MLSVSGNGKMAPPRIPSGNTAGMANILMPMYVRPKVSVTNHQLSRWYALAHSISDISFFASFENSDQSSQALIVGASGALYSATAQNAPSTHRQPM